MSRDASRLRQKGNLLRTSPFPPFDSHSSQHLIPISHLSPLPLPVFLLYHTCSSSFALFFSRHIISYNIIRFLLFYAAGCFLLSWISHGIRVFYSAWACTWSCSDSIALICSNRSPDAFLKTLGLVRVSLLSRGILLFI